MRRINLAFLVERQDASQATWIKTVKITKTTQLYGISSCDVLRLLPVAVKTKFQQGYESFVDSSKIRGFLKEKEAQDNDLTTTLDVLFFYSFCHDYSAKGYHSMQDETYRVQSCAILSRQTRHEKSLPSYLHAVNVDLEKVNFFLALETTQTALPLYNRYQGSRNGVFVPR